jgi:hypothetical protein
MPRGNRYTLLPMSTLRRGSRNRFQIALGAMITAMVLAACLLPSKVPDIRATTSDTTAAVSYVSELSKSVLSYSFADGLESPDRSWKLFINRENNRDDLAGFYAAKLLNMSSGQSRTLFTFWDADVGSGFRLRIAWSRDSKAIRFRGQTRGFAYHHPKDEPFDFDFINVLPDSTMYSMIVSDK